MASQEQIPQISASDRSLLAERGTVFMLPITCGLSVVYTLGICFSLLAALIHFNSFHNPQLQKP